MNLDVVHPDHPALSVSIADGNARLAGDQDGALLEIVVHNYLPCVSLLILAYFNVLFTKGTGVSV